MMAIVITMKITMKITKIVRMLDSLASVGGLLKLKHLFFRGTKIFAKMIKIPQGKDFIRVKAINVTDRKSVV